MSNTPSDEELNSVLCHHWPAFPMQAVLVQMWLRDAMRAALVKWGTPPPVVRESSEDLYWRLHSLSKILEGSGVIDESRNPDAYTTILDAMAFVRTPQPAPDCRHRPPCAECAARARLGQKT